MTFYDENDLKMTKRWGHNLWFKRFQPCQWSWKTTLHAIKHSGFGTSLSQLVDIDKAWVSEWVKSRLDNRWYLNLCSHHSNNRSWGASTEHIPDLVLTETELSLYRYENTFVKRHQGRTDLRLICYKQRESKRETSPTC